MQLTKNFSLSEMVKSNTAVRLNIDNTPGEKEVVNLKTLCENVLQKIRDHYGVAVDVSSGFRCAKLNVAVKGSPTSDHCFGQAADIEIEGITNPDLAKWIIDNLQFTQVILEFYERGKSNSGWVHVSYVKNNLKKQVLTAIKKDGKTVYLPGLQP